METARRTTLNVSDAVAVIAQKGWRLMLLHFAMLNRRTAQQIVQLNRQYSGSTGFILWSFQSQPKVHVPRQTILVVFFRLSNENNAFSKFKFKAKRVSGLRSKWCTNHRWRIFHDLVPGLQLARNSTKKIEEKIKNEFQWRTARSSRSHYVIIGDTIAAIRDIPSKVAFNRFITLSTNLALTKIQTRRFNVSTSLFPIAACREASE